MTRPRSTAFFVLSAVAALAAVPACSSSSGEVAPAPSREAAASALTAEVIIPAYEELATDTDALVTAIEGACSGATAPDETQRTSAQDAWREAQDAWVSTRAFRFGPTKQLRAMSKIAYPVDTEKLAELVGGSEPLDVEALRETGADQRGLGAVEWVLFGAEPIDARRCELAASASLLVAEEADLVVERWKGEAAVDPNERIADAVNGMIFALGELADMKLAAAAGGVSGTPAPEEADAGAAHNALNDMQSMIDSVDQLRSGGPTGGIGALVAGVEEEPDERLVDELTALRNAIAAIAPPLAEATDSAQLTAAYEAALTPLVTLRTEIASLLGVTLQLADSDGDS